MSLQLDELDDAFGCALDHLDVVLGLAAGRLGGEGRTEVGGRGSWFGQAAVVRRLASAFGPEQLRKAVLEVERVVRCCERLRISDRSHRIVDVLDALVVADLPDRMRVARPGSPDLVEVHRLLTAASNAVRQERVRLALERRRSTKVRSSGGTNGDLVDRA